MFSHVMVGSNDIARSKKFYDALFVAMGAKPGVEDARGRLSYTHNGGRTAKPRRAVLARRFSRAKEPGLPQSYPIESVCPSRRPLRRLLMKMCNCERRQRLTSS